jgi:hypothetical protein
MPPPAQRPFTHFVRGYVGRVYLGKDCRPPVARSGTGV